MAFQMPEEFAQGFAKAGQAWWTSLLPLRYLTPPDAWLVTVGPKAPAA